MKLIAEIIALPGWNTSMLLLLAKATLILIAALGITVAMQRASAGSRHLVWLITLGALLLVPALATFTPLRMEILPESTQRAVQQNATDGSIQFHLRRYAPPRLHRCPLRRRSAHAFHPQLLSLRFEVVSSQH
jgi:hypothetical protein